MVGHCALAGPLLKQPDRELGDSPSGWDTGVYYAGPEPEEVKGKESLLEFKETETEV